MPGYIELRLRSPDGLPEIDADRILQIAALFGFQLRRAAAFAAAEKLRKQIAKGSAIFRLPCAAAGFALLARKIGKIEAVEIHIRTAGTLRTAAAATRTAALRHVVRIEPDLIVNRALLVIAQDVVRFLNRLEAVFGRLIAGVQIRVIFTRELPVGFPDLVRRGRFRHIQRLVIIF